LLLLWWWLLLLLELSNLVLLIKPFNSVPAVGILRKLVTSVDHITSLLLLLLLLAYLLLLLLLLALSLLCKAKIQLLNSLLKFGMILSLVTKGSVMF
jgi:hypothetical protein